MASFLLPACAITLVLLFLSPVPTFAGDFVLDIHGKQVETGVDYYMVPQLYGTGGLMMTPRNNSPCPQYFIKQQAYSAGSPLKIAPLVTTQFLTTGLPVALYFTHTPTTCNNSLRWWVTPKKVSNDQSYVIVGVDEGEFKSTYFFTIEQAKESKYGYNIKFCHVMESKIVGTLLTNDVGFLNDHECNDLGFLNGLLGITPNEPFPFVFVKFSE